MQRIEDSNTLTAESARLPKLGLLWNFDILGSLVGGTDP